MSTRHCGASATLPGGLVDGSVRYDGYNRLRSWIPRPHQSSASNAARARAARGARALARCAGAQSGVSRSMISLDRDAGRAVRPRSCWRSSHRAGSDWPRCSMRPPRSRRDRAARTARRSAGMARSGVGYVRRNVSPPGVPQPMQIVEVHFPPAARVAFENGGRDLRVHQQVWVLEGSIDVTRRRERHRLREGRLPGDAARSPDDVPQPDAKARALRGRDRVRDPAARRSP